MLAQLNGVLWSGTPNYGEQSISTPTNSSSGAEQWEAEAVWPKQADLRRYNVKQGLFTVEAHSLRDKVVSTVTGRGTKVTGRKIQLGKRALVFDSACSNVKLEDMEITGAMCSLYEYSDKWLTCVGTLAFNRNIQ